MRRTCFFALALLAFVGISCKPEPQGERALVTCPFVAKAPSIDGQVGKNEWSGTPAATPFFDVVTKAQGPVATRARVAFNDNCFYVSFVCEDPDPAHLVANAKKHDDGVWYDDDVEVFLTPEPDGTPYYHVMVNPSGVVADECCYSPDNKDLHWDSGARVATRKTDKGWTAEIAIPFEKMPRWPEVGQSWRVNFARHYARENMWLAWSPPKGESLHEPGCLGEMFFAPWEGECSIESAGRVFLGQNAARFHLPKGKEKQYECMVFVKYDPDLGPRTIKKVGASKIDYMLPVEGKGYVQCAIVDRSVGAAICRTPRLRFDIAENFKVLSATTKRARSFTHSLFFLPVSPDVRKANALKTREIRKKLQDIKNELEILFAAPHPSPKEWNAVSQELARINEKIDRLSYRLKLRRNVPGKRTADFLIGTQSSLKKVLLDKPFEGQVGKAAEIDVARNENEAVQLVILPLAQDLKQVRVRWTNPQDDKGHTLPSASVTVYRVGYVKTRKPCYPIDYVGYYPDPFFPLDVFDVPGDKLQPIWFAVKPTSDAVPGTYRSTVTIEPVNVPAQSIDVIIHVWPFALPKTTTLKTAFALFDSTIKQFYGYTKIPKDVRRRFYKFLLERRINPTNIYSSTPVPPKEDLEWCIKQGLNAFNVRHISKGIKWTPEVRKKNLEFYKNYYAYLEKNGWTHLAYTYCFDEPTPKDYALIRKVFADIHAVCPKLKRVTTEPPHPDLFGYVDIYVPLTADYDEKICHERQEAGDEIWWYICCGPRHPYANWFIDYPAIEPRLLFWMTYKYRVTGFLYYALNMWSTNCSNQEGGWHAPHADPAIRKKIEQGVRWPDIPWNTFTYSRFNGDGLLIYPGPHGVPYTSQRLEVIRDGIEDYEMLHLLETRTRQVENLANSLPDKNKDLVKRATRFVKTCRKVLAVPPPVVKDLTHFTHDPKVLLDERLKVMKLLVKANKMLKDLEGRVKCCSNGNREKK